MSDTAPPSGDYDARLTAIVRTAVDGIITIDERGIIQTVNPAAERLFGYTTHELLGQNVSLLMPPPDRARHDQYLEAYRATGRAKIIGIGREVVARRHDGALFPIHLSIGEFQFQGRRYFTGIIRDETKRKRAEERFRATVESAPLGMVMIDPAGAIVLANAEAERMFGYRRHELLGQRVELLVPQRFHAHHPALRRQFLADPTARRMGAGRDLFARRKDGSEFPVEIGLNPIVTEEGTLVLSAIVDITARKQLESMLTLANQDLETLLFVASHDLREPLRAIHNFAEIVGDRYAAGLDERGRDYVKRIAQAATRMNRLLEELLTLSRAHRMEPPQDRIPAENIVADVLERLRERIRERRAMVMVQPGLPTIQVNRFWATEAIYNLVANALKFTRDGDPPDVTIAATPGGLGLMVRDRGPGVDPACRERIFELFQRAVGREVEGTGAGLAIVAQVAARHGGAAWVQPRADGGSEFCITFGPEKKEGNP